MKYYVVSPNAANDGLADEYLAYMKRQHVVFMGWDTSHKSGAMFSRIQPGDCILVARRQNWEWKSYFSGIAGGVDHEGFAALRFMDHIRKIVVETADGQLGDIKHSDSPEGSGPNISCGIRQASVRIVF